MNTTMKNVKQNCEPRSGERHARIETIGRAPGRVLLAVTIAACLWTPMNSGARAQTYVTPVGSFAPREGTSFHPYSLIEAAVVAERTDALIRVSSGIYKEAFSATRVPIWRKRFAVRAIRLDLPICRAVRT